MILEENKPLAPFTTFGIGGPARWYVEAGTEAEIVEAAEWARERGIELFVLGGGSNLLVADAGFNGLVLRVGLKGISVTDTEESSLKNSSHDSETETAGPSIPFPFDKLRVRSLRMTSSPDAELSGGVVDQTEKRIYQAAAGEHWDDFVQRTIDDGCAGLECLAGIPGTVGGTPVQNVGAYGQEVASVIVRVRAYDLAERVFAEFTNTECGFGYRRSRFNTADRGRYIVTRVDFALRANGAPTVGYADLQRAFADRPAGAPPLTLAEVAATVRRVRQSKGMLLVDGDADCRSAGSFFKNPIIREDRLAQIASAAGQPPPRFQAGPGDVKVPAAWLIEQAGFSKGYMRGGAAISSKHTLALVNLGHSGDGSGTTRPVSATAAEILALASEINAAVEGKFQIRLQMEPVMLGF